MVFKKIFFILSFIPLIAMASTNGLKDNNTNNNDVSVFKKIFQLDMKYKNFKNKYIEENCGKAVINKQNEQIDLANKKIKEFEKTLKIQNDKLKQLKEQNSILKDKYKKALLALQSYIQNKGKINIENKNGNSNNNIDNSNEIIIESINFLQFNGKIIRKEVKLKINNIEGVFEKGSVFKTYLGMVKVEKINKNNIVVSYLDSKKKKYKTIYK